MLIQPAIDELSSKKYWTLDVDDCMYAIETGLHTGVVIPTIAKEYNKVAAHDPKGKIIANRVAEILEAQGAKISNPSEIKPSEILLAFPPIVQSLKEAYPDKLLDYLKHFYGNEYHRIMPSSSMIEAFKIAQNKGIDIYFYTNGPAQATPGDKSHFEKVMDRIGFDESMIKNMRTKTYDILMSIEAGRGKPTKEGMQDFLNFSNIDPNKSLMADDSVKNLKTANEFGMATIWTWTTDKRPENDNVEIAKNIGAHRVRNTGSALLQIANAHKVK